MDIIYGVYLILLLLIAIAGFTRFKKLSKGFRILTGLILCTLISESIKKVYGKIYHNNMPIAHIWAVIEYVLFSLTYFYLLTSRWVKKAIIVSMVAMLILEIVNVLFFEKLTKFPSLILEASHIIYVVDSLLLFRQMLLFPTEQSLFKQSLFWFNINVLFYATTMFLNFALLSYFIENKLDILSLVYFSMAVNLIFYIVIGISILMDNNNESVTEFSNG